MSHEMVSAALGLMCIPFLYIRLILHLLRAPYLYTVGKGYVPGVYHHPRAGTRQGDPCSPALFSLVASFVIFPLQDLRSRADCHDVCRRPHHLLGWTSQPTTAEEGMGSGVSFWTVFGAEGQPEQNGSDSSQLWGNGVGEVLSGHWSGRQKFCQVSGCTLGEYSAPTG